MNTEISTSSALPPPPDELIPIKLDMSGVVMKPNPNITNGVPTISKENVIKMCIEKMIEVRKLIESSKFADAKEILLDEIKLEYRETNDKLFDQTDYTNPVIKGLFNEYFKYLGIIYCNSGLINNALRLFSISMQYDPYDHASCNNLLYCYYTLRDTLNEIQLKDMLTTTKRLIRKISCEDENNLNTIKLQIFKYAMEMYMYASTRLKTSTSPHKSIKIVKQFLRTKKITLDTVKPEEILYYSFLASLYVNNRSVNKSQKIYGKLYDIVKDDPNISIPVKLSFIINQYLSIPDIYDSVSEIEYWRKYYSDGLTFIDETITKNGWKYTSVEEFLSIPQAKPGFSLAYHNKNDREIISRTSELYRKLIPDINYVAEHLKGMSKNDLGLLRLPLTSSGKIKIAFISYHLFFHSVSKDRRGIIYHLPRDKFEIHVYSFATAHDGVSQEIKNNVDFWTKMENTATSPTYVETCKLLEKEKFDIIFYPAIGMEINTFLYAHARLAPIQIATWGHSDTTGISTIDYYMSSRYFEVNDILEARSHYSETLVPLSSLGTYYYNPIKKYVFKASKGTKNFTFDLMTNNHNNNTTTNGKFTFICPPKNVLICPHSEFKLNPEFDLLIKEIFKLMPDAYVFTLTGNFDGKYNKKILSRMSKIFTTDELGHIQPVQFQPYEGYIRMLSLGRVVLDPYPFGGFNTSLESFALGKPVVTLPSNYINGHFTAGLYNRMGGITTECIAKDAADYAKIIYRLNNDDEYYQKMCSTIFESSKKLFKEKESAYEYTAFLESRIYQTPLTDKFFIERSRFVLNESFGNVFKTHNIKNIIHVVSNDKIKTIITTGTAPPGTTTRTVIRTDEDIPTSSSIGSGSQSININNITYSPIENVELNKYFYSAEKNILSNFFSPENIETTTFSKGISSFDVSSTSPVGTATGVIFSQLIHFVANDFINLFESDKGSGSKVYIILPLVSEKYDMSEIKKLAMLSGKYDIKFIMFITQIDIAQTIVNMLKTEIPSQGRLYPPSWNITLIPSIIHTLPRILRRIYPTYIADIGILCSDEMLGKMKFDKMKDSCTVNDLPGMITGKNESSVIGGKDTVLNVVNINTKSFIGRSCQIWRNTVHGFRYVITDSLPIHQYLLQTGVFHVCVMPINDISDPNISALRESDISYYFRSWEYGKNSNVIFTENIDTAIDVIINKYKQRFDKFVLTKEKIVEQK